jgi:hypothetical protein
VLQAEGRLPQEADEATWIDGTRYGIYEAAAMVGLSVETLHAWDRLGLVVPGRYPSWFRVYSEADIKRLLTYKRPLETTTSSNRSGSPSAVVELTILSAWPMPQLNT